MRHFSRLFIFAVIFLTAASGWAAPPRSPAALPDAPVPHSVSRGDGESAANFARQGPQQNSAAQAGQNFAPLYDRIVFPGQQARPLTARNKFIFAARQTIEPINLTPAIISAGYGQFSNDDPKYGTGSGAFAQRFGAAVLRQDSYRLLADGFMPILFREDPRYYRSGEGSVVKRFVYAIGQTFVSRTDSGAVVPNYAGLLGRGIAAALTYTYYPPASADARVVLTTYATSIAGDAGLNILRELTPEKVYRKLRKLHLRVTGQ